MTSEPSHIRNRFCPRVLRRRAHVERFLLSSAPQSPRSFDAPSRRGSLPNQAFPSRTQMQDLSGGSAMMTVGILSLLTLVIGVSWALARRRRRNAQNRKDDIPLFTIPVSELMTIGRPSIDPGRARRNTPAHYQAVGLPTNSPPIDGRDVAPQGAPTIRTRDGAVSTLSLPLRHEPGPGPAPEGEGEAAGEPFDGASIRYWRAADGTLQFLPGRLSISAGHDAGQ